MEGESIRPGRKIKSGATPSWRGKKGKRKKKMPTLPVASIAVLAPGTQFFTSTPSCCLFSTVRLDRIQSQPNYHQFPCTQPVVTVGLIQFYITYNNAAVPFIVHDRSSRLPTRRHLIHLETKRDAILQSVNFN